MNKREKNILDAAMQVFTRYGVKRTSMNDLCQEAGISRQTLYNVYRNKDEILRALIRDYTSNAITEIEAKLESSGDLGDQLDVVIDKMVLAGFDLVEAMPNAEEFVEGVNASSKDELEESAERFRAVIEKILSPHEAALAHSGHSASDLSDFFQRSTKDLHHNARNRDHLVRLLDTLKNLCLAAAENSKT